MEFHTRGGGPSKNLRMLYLRTIDKTVGIPHPIKTVRYTMANYDSKINNSLELQPIQKDNARSRLSLPSVLIMELFI